METPKKQRERREKALDALVDVLYQEVAANVRGWYDSAEFANSALRRALKGEIKKTLKEINQDVLGSRLTFDALRKKISPKEVDDFQLSTVLHRVRKEFRDAVGMKER